MEVEKVKKQRKEKDYLPRVQKRLTLRRLIDNNEEIWVRNNSENTNRRGVACQVIFQVGHGDTVDAVKIPPGSDPICITDQVDPDSLKTCRDLFKLIKTGTLELLDPVNAEEYYKNHVQRKQIVEEKINKMLKPMPVPNRPHDANRPDPKQIRKDAGVSIALHPRTTDICLKARHGAVTEGAALESLREQESVLQASDFEYLMTNGVFVSVKRWAKDKINGMNTTE
jgi:hypothetical protein